MFDTINEAEYLLYYDSYNYEYVTKFIQNTSINRK